MRNPRLFFLCLGKALLSSTLLLDINMNPIPSSHCAVCSPTAGLLEPKTTCSFRRHCESAPPLQNCFRIPVRCATPGERSAHRLRGKSGRMTRLAEGAGRPKYASKCPLQYSTFPRRIRTPNLLRDRLRKLAQLPLALLNLSIRLLQFGCSFLHPHFKLVAGRSDGRFGPFSRGAHDCNGDCAKDKCGEKALGLLRDRHRVERRDKKVVDQERR